MAKCPVCKRKVDTLRTSIKNGKLISERCERCLANFSGFADGARSFERKWQQRHYARDTIQPFEPEFIKEYPNEAYKYGWNEEDYRKYG